MPQSPMPWREKAACFSQHREQLRQTNLPNILSSLNQEERHLFSEFTKKIVGNQYKLRMERAHASIEADDSLEHDVNLVDMGYGIGQIFPVLLQLFRAKALSNKKGLRTLIFEQPETHLHPKLQARLGDAFFHTISKGKKEETAPMIQILIETHSEHLINRLGLLIHWGKLDPSQVSVYLINRNPETHWSEVEKANFNSDGTLSNWPHDFFEPDWDDSLNEDEQAMELE